MLNRKTNQLRGLRHKTCKPKVSKEEDFKSRLDEAQAWAKSVCYKESDIDDAVEAVRSSKRA
jgi:hypothetical protein